VSWAQCEAPAAGEKYTLLSPKESTHTEVDDMTKVKRFNPSVTFLLLLTFFRTMADIFTSLLLLAYAVMGLVAVFAFGPTIRDLWIGKSGVNNTTYLVWLTHAVIASLYALIIVSDFTMLMLSSLYAVCCCVVLSLNWRFQRRNRVVTISVEAQDLTLTSESLV